MPEFKRYLCVICGYIYDEELGDEDSSLAAGTRWEDIPAEWLCPDCGAGKDDFELIVP
jgi:rubredoxin